MNRAGAVTGVVVALCLAGPSMTVASAQHQQSAARQYYVTDVGGDANGVGWNYYSDGGVVGALHDMVDVTVQLAEDQVEQTNGVAAEPVNVASADVLGVAFSTPHEPNPDKPGFRATGWTTFVRTTAVPQNDLVVDMHGILENVGSTCAFALSLTGTGAGEVTARLDVGNSFDDRETSCPPGADVTVALPAGSARIVTDDPGVEVTVPFSVLPASAAAVVAHRSTVLYSRVWSTQSGDPRFQVGVGGHGWLDKTPAADPFVLGEDMPR